MVHLPRVLTMNGAYRTEVCSGWVSEWVGNECQDQGHHCTLQIDIVHTAHKHHHLHVSMHFAVISLSNSIFFSSIVILWDHIYSPSLIKMLHGTGLCKLLLFSSREFLINKKQFIILSQSNLTPKIAVTFELWWATVVFRLFEEQPKILC